MLATVTCGLFVSWNGPRFISPATRLQGFFVWDLVVYLVESVVFLLTGLAGAAWWPTRWTCRNGTPGAGLRWRSAPCLIVVRFVWVFVATYLPRLVWPALASAIPRRPGKASSSSRFTGIRGVVSLAAALSIPLMADGEPFPERGLLLLVTFAVILVTLVGQGFTLPWVIGKLGIAEHGRREADEDKQREIAARLASIDAALARLDPLEAAAAAPETVAALRRRHEDRRAYFVAACQDLVRGDVSSASAALQLQFVDAERAQHRRSLLPGRDQRRSPPPHRAGTGPGRFPHPPCGGERRGEGACSVVTHPRAQSASHDRPPSRPSNWLRHRQSWMPACCEARRDGAVFS